MRHLTSAIVLAGLLAGSAWAELQTYDQYQYDSDDTVRRQYNAPERRWETTRGQKVLKYNAPEREWSYEDPNALPVYNAPERKWEYPK